MFEMQQLAELQVLYPEYKLSRFEDLLVGVGKDSLMRVVTYLIGMDLYSDKKINNKEVIENWFSTENGVFAQDAYDRIVNYENKEKKSLKIVHVISCLKMLQYGLELQEKGELNTKSKEQSEIDLFFAMLLLNQNEDYNQTKDKAKIKAMFPRPEHTPAALLLNYSFPVNDITNFYFPEYTYCQIIKAFLVFEFLETTGEGKELLKRFYKYYDIGSWQEYFERVIPLIQGWTKRDNASSVDLVLEKNDKYASNFDFLERLAMSDYIKLEDVDFIKIREKPLLKLDDYTFRVIHPLFIADKIYKGLYFLFNQLNSEEPKLIKAFRSWYTTNFSEGFCLKSLIEYGLPNPDCLLFDADFKEKKIVGPPDCYIRLVNDSFLLENKDILINASIKSSYDFEMLIGEISKKLIEEDGRPVGVGQLITNIRKLLTEENKYDEGFSKDKNQIYPVLVTYDNMFDTPGLNRILGISFFSELQKLKAKGLNISRVLPLIVLNVDTLIEVAPLLKKGAISLKELCEAFYTHFRVKPMQEYPSEQAYINAYQDSLLSFSHYIPHYLTAKLGSGWRSEELLHHLFEKLEIKKQ